VFVAGLHRLDQTIQHPSHFVDTFSNLFVSGARDKPKAKCEFELDVDFDLRSMAISR